MGNVEGLLKAAIPVVIGVLIAGFIMNQLAGSVSIIASAQSGFSGSGS